MGVSAEKAFKDHKAKGERFSSPAHKAESDRFLSSPFNRILRLQQTIGNQAVQRIMKAGVIQAKLLVGRPDDEYEKEADRVAEQVTQTPETPPEGRNQPEDDEIRLPAKPLAGEITPLAQRQTEEEEEEPIQAQKAYQQPAEVNLDLESRLKSYKGGGRSLLTAERTFFEPRFGRDFSRVRLHTDAEADEAARQLSARAFTQGEDVYFGSGRYAPEADEGRRLLAHELAHVVQQEGGSRRPPASERVQRQTEEPKKEEQPEGYTTVETHIQQAFQAIGCDIDDLDVYILAQSYPNGIQIVPERLFAIAIGAGTIQAVKIPGYRILPVEPLTPGYVTYFLHVSKARGIVLHERGGMPVVFDMGRHGPAGFAALRAAGLTGDPQLVKISHGHLDHIEGLPEFLRQNGMQNAQIEIASQVLRNPLAQDMWQKIGIDASSDRRVVEISVTGSGVNIEKNIIGNMEIVELRLTSAVQKVGQAETRSQYSAAQNPAVPITIVRDRVTGQTQLLTSDMAEKSFNEMVDLVGERAFLEMIGGKGRLLVRAEERHHGGAVPAGTEAAMAYLRRFWIQMEASGGNIELITQTDPAFVDRPTSSIRILRAIGEDVTEIFGPSGAESGTPVTERRGTEGRTLEIDRGIIVKTREWIRQNGGPIREAYRAREDLQRLLDELRPLQAVWSQAKGSRQARSIAELEGDIRALEERINIGLAGARAALETAARRHGGLSAAMDTSEIKPKIAELEKSIYPKKDLVLFTNSIQTHRAMLELPGALIANSLAMLQAYQRGDHQRVHEMREIQEKLLDAAEAELGVREVAEHVKSAWDLTRVRQGTRGLSRVLAEQRVARVSGITGLQVGRQLQLTRLRTLAEQGAAPSPRGLGQSRGARIGAGILLVIEALNIILELAEQVEASIEASKVKDLNKAIRGQNMVAWWMHRGVVPELGLLDEDDNEVKLGQDKIYESLKRDGVGGVPKDAHVVVVGISQEDRLAALDQLEMEVHNLDDWYRVIYDRRKELQESGFRPFELLDDGKWYTLLYDMKGKKFYGDFDEKVHQRLAAFHNFLRLQTSKELKKLPGERKTVADTALLLGTDRIVIVYNEYGRRMEIDFGEREPTFVVYEIHAEETKSLWFDPEYTIGRAADPDTYASLRKYWWPSDKEFMSNQGWGFYFYPNHQGLCYVKTANLRPLAGAGKK